MARDGTKIATLEHFLVYAQHSPVAARQLFTQKDFMIWLFNTGYPCMDMYEIFAADPLKERAIDNFLVFNGLKSKATIVANNKNILINIGHGDDVVTGGISLQRSGQGYVEGNLTVKSRGDWLKLSKDKISGADFDENNRAEIDYMILPENLSGRDVAVVDLKCSNPQQIYIHCAMARPFEARLDKESYYFEDKGKLYLTNNTGRDLMIDIFCENFVKFEAKRYLISKYAEIDFDIKFSTIRAATLALRKQLYATTQIHVMAVSGERNSVARLVFKLWGKG